MTGTEREQAPAVSRADCADIELLFALDSLDAGASQNVDTCRPSDEFRESRLSESQM
jgi:hypothetical protein